MAKRDKWHQRVGRQEAEDKAEQVCVVVYPWQDAQRQQPQQDQDQLGQCATWVLQHRPAMQHFDHQRGKQSEMRAGWTDL